MSDKDNKIIRMIKLLEQNSGLPVGSADYVAEQLKPTKPTSIRLIVKMQRQIEEHISEISIQQHGVKEELRNLQSASNKVNKSIADFRVKLVEYRGLIESIEEEEVKEDA